MAVPFETAEHTAAAVAGIAVAVVAGIAVAVAAGTAVAAVAGTATAVVAAWDGRIVVPARRVAAARAARQ